MQHHVSAKLYGLLEIWRHESVVHHHLAATLMCDLADYGDVGQPHQWVCGGLEVNEARALADGPSHVARIGGIDVGELQSEIRQHLVEQAGHAPIEIV